MDERSTKHFLLSLAKHFFAGWLTLAWLWSLGQWLMKWALVLLLKGPSVERIALSFAELFGLSVLGLMPYLVYRVYIKPLQPQFTSRKHRLVWSAKVIGLICAMALGLESLHLLTEAQRERAITSAAEQSQAPRGR